MAASAAAAAALERLATEFVYDSLAVTPVAATAAGYHHHHGRSLDDELDDLGPRGILASRRLLARTERRLARIAPAALDPEQAADLEIVRNAVAATRLDLDEIQPYRHNPAFYVELIGNAVYSPYVLHYAPAAQRFAQITHRLARVPAFLSQARHNLVDAPPVWNRVARAEDAGTIGLIEQSLRADCPAGQRAEFDRAARAAVRAMHGFDRWLEGDLAQHVSDWRLGRDLYAKKFALTLATGHAPDELLAQAEADLSTTRAEMARLVAPRSVEAALAEVANQHATPDTYLSAARSALAQARAFVLANHLIDLPMHDNLEVIETPVFMRGSYGVGGFNPAPPLEPGLGAFFWVTPIEPGAAAGDIESKLREYNDAGLAHLTVHEAMPGHYVQAEYASTIRPTYRELLRSLYGNGPYIEGWAVYAQQLMAEQGYRSDSIGYRLTLEKQMLRVIANTILDVRLQTHGMSEAEALDLMIKQTYQEPAEATAKLQRAELSSCQLPTYYAGLNGWLAVRSALRAEQGAGFDLKRFHERALREGAVPLPALERLLMRP
jgi:uncharacterized protein (DUF885 family)